MKKFSLLGPPSPLFDVWPAYTRDANDLLISDPFREWSGDGDYFAFDNQFNTDGTLPNAKINPSPIVPTYMTGNKTNIFYCPALTRSYNGIIIGFNYHVRDAFVRVFKFTNHDPTILESGSGRPGFPFGGFYERYAGPKGFRYYGDHDPVVHASSQVPYPTPSPLPTWNFTNPNGFVFLTCVAASDTDNTDLKGFDSAEANASEAAMYVSSGWLGYTPGTPGTIAKPAFEETIMTSQILGPFTSSGVTRGIDPTFHNTIEGALATPPRTPFYNVWKSVVAFGMESAPGHTLSFATDSYHHILAEDYSTTVHCDNTTGTTFPAAAGDGILVIASCAAYSTYTGLA